MNETHLLMIFIGVSSVAILIQAFILIALYASSRKTAAKVRKRLCIYFALKVKSAVVALPPATVIF